MTVEHEQWGPLGLHAEQIIRRVGRLTADECRRLASAWDAWTAPAPVDGPLDFGDTPPWQVTSDEWNDAEDALDAAVAAAGRTDQAEAAAKAAEDAVWDAVWDFAAVGLAQADRAIFAASVAASAAAAVDLAGTGGPFTIDHLNMLLGPWRAVVDEDTEPVCECER